MAAGSSPFQIGNIRYFIAFRVFFNSRFYYPVFTILFLDYGLTIEQFALLNSVWAATIVLAEVPSGALADLMGRKQLLMTTSLLMMAEMALLSFVPIENITLVFWAFLINRILSGLAEAMASGADEALAYDSLVEHGNRDDWPRVLSVMMRFKSLGALLSMTIGALIYDPEVVNWFLERVNSGLTLNQQDTMRFPIYLTLVLSILSCVSVLMMQEFRKKKDTQQEAGHLANILESLRLVMQAGRWIIETPFALVIILFGMAYDHVLRLAITLISQYFRLIELPEASFGIIGGGIAMLGLWLPKVAEKMSLRYSAQQNMLWMCGITMSALIGMAAFIPYAGLIFMAFVSIGLMFTSFFTSHYLNRITESHQRATVLSFKGLAFNLAYGLIGVVFATVMSELRHTLAGSQLSETAIENEAFKEAFFYLSPYTAAILIVIVVLSRYLLRSTRIHTVRG